ncbi:hypothetical protein G443_000996 [Actinoalloteichus cyanogriseus DSM 43889]|uniref:Basic proline-rich protein n=1 Tax=Actinoalloteichus caeruleus DSM 43889 TaxID=1120930 RepID=A0ABT1JE06_ACTCY|nr:hypothetical protein [Actinoalloteichus caeruleus DSM 43889]
MGLRLLSGTTSAGTALGSVRRRRRRPRPHQLVVPSPGRRCGLLRGSPSRELARLPRAHPERVPRSVPWAAGARLEGTPETADPESSATRRADTGARPGPGDVPSGGGTPVPPLREPGPPWPSRHTDPRAHLAHRAATAPGGQRHHAHPPGARRPDPPPGRAGTGTATAGGTAPTTPVHCRARRAPAPGRGLARPRPARRRPQPAPRNARPPSSATHPDERASRVGSPPTGEGHRCWQARHDHRPRAHQPGRGTPEPATTPTRKG